ncbi:X-ray repair cross-complementing protein 6 [Haplosporangium bisporale]|nr:X-ray repair cross-complementing protein 6 [Haplosporangium bisporale]
MSSSWRSRDEEPEDEENEEVVDNETKWGSSRDSILFVIDCSPPMLQPDQEGEVPFKTAIKCASAVLLNKIVTSETDLVGIVLYGTAKSKNANNFENIYVLQDLDAPDVHKILQLESVENESFNFDEEIGTSNGKYTLGEMFWTATNLFGASAQKVGSKRVFLFTNEDDPHRGDIGLRSASKVRAKDLQEFGILVDLFDIDKPGEKFDRTLFYQDLLLHDADENEDADTQQEKATANLGELLQRVQRKEHKKRVAGYLPFKLAPGLEIGVKTFNLVISQGKGMHRNVYTLGDTVREVQTVTTYICADTTQFLMPSDLKYYWEFGQTKVIFSKDEVAAMKTFGPPGLALIGFKPKSAIHMHHNIEHALFLYPDERSYQGSTAAFTSLLTAMAELDKVAICSFTARTNHTTRLVALVPQLEVIGAEGQVQPPGFQVYPLPWADDIRQMPMQSEYTPPTDLVDAAKAIISKLNMKKGFNPLNYENPTLQKHFKVLQATALDRPDTDIEDKTLPKTEQMHLRAGDYIRHFKEIADTAELPEIPAPTPTASSKRASQSQPQGSPSKRQNTGPASAQDMLNDMRIKYQSGQMNKATVAQMKDFLASVNIQGQGKKADLISQVEDYFDQA